MPEIDDLIAQIENKGHKVWKAGLVPDADVQVLEKKMGVTLPPSYRSFLLKYGGMAIYDSTISGVVGDPLSRAGGSLFGDTIRFREKWDLPEYLLVIQPDEDAPYCLNARYVDRQGEMPVICFELHSRHEGKIAQSFDDWIKEWFLRGWAEDTD